ncbi:hypothetical protein ALO36_103348 [Pseudomonas syringae pv. tomato]|uniref:Uncharacterized protein n=1 Tax=Pseudomonas syringae pv. maculicola TaxID=59511 RepID=A0A0N0WV28_PSEYM|nr:Unknown protein sequence [Pseudomonas syringae pv. maculicola]KPC00917.1 Unknown protein sequence [Pseudomonas syringae pv. maculicola]KPY93303.1 hypothetical protein ALO36_103348 [Pseudomonas syringae pv. tomato]RMM72581.1 hypothetical protein ALQ72_100628 [Pseudomonas syringae pv. maculicola]RMV26097.1 hypothetical protein ALP13_103124 [Pseudomonas syringae pv. maculicola]
MVAQETAVYQEVQGFDGYGLSASDDVHFALWDRVQLIT